MYYCDNETVHGVEYPSPPSAGPFNQLLITDMTSNFLSRKFDVTKFGLIYAGSQKNFGVPGLTIVIIRNDLISGSEEIKDFPSEFSFRKQFLHKSAKLPTFALAFTREYLLFMKNKGGMEVIDQEAKDKSNVLYELIDNSGGFYRNLVEKAARSRMNVPCFILNDNKELTNLFKEEAGKNGLLQLGGHSSLGGLRFSIYNGMPMEGVQKLKAFMLEFQKKYGMRPRL